MNTVTVLTALGVHQLFENGAFWEKVQEKGVLNLGLWSSKTFELIEELVEIADFKGLHDLPYRNGNRMTFSVEKLNATY
ncbi:hypothetical protein CDAR_213601 [Caerostris darwini]|uniref:Uncharacterized protein n=1 Tax=Caerostris darwini TaxID=1538125 RepID=A0AAV4T5K1_9ARAC|nr:hypothetical protein CDAR_213601 [Caerostris darwini]